MISYEEIRSQALWGIKFETGHRMSGTYEEIKPYISHPDADEHDILCWEAQPPHLQEFFKDYEYATWHQKRHDLYLLEDFYKEWSKDPQQFKPKQSDVIGKLSDLLKDYDVSSNLIVNNYDGKTAGNHHVGNFVEALEENNYEFDVVRLEISGKDTEWETPVIIVQTDDPIAFNTFGYTANKKAIEHDKIMGDGKYCGKEEPEEERE